ncbi:MAG: ACT domain-containing protein [Thermoprotei archaeon]|nr:MAG: ACT domain-containing protein [Thermoprotei archaeon]RLF03160.1 MAG: ACT domain-containing protein [Thermoprotei archaeon]
MRRRERSISELVREYVTVRPCILEALKRGIVNYSALARAIVLELSSIYEGMRFNTPAIKMALRRYSEELEAIRETFEEKIIRILASSSLQLINDIVVFTTSGFAVPYVLSKELTSLKHRFLQLTQSPQHTTIMIDKESFESLYSALERKRAQLGEIEILRDQTAILVNSPPEIIKTPGVIAYILSALAYHGVNITQFISCHTDTILIVDRKEALRAYSILEKLILTARQMLEEQF